MLEGRRVMYYKKYLLASSVIFLMMAVAFPSVAAAYCISAFYGNGYYESVYDASGYYYGAYAWNYAMRYPVTVGDAPFPFLDGSWHVNSVTVGRADGRTWAELGWVAYGINRIPFFFRARSYNGDYTDDDLGVVPGYPGGTNHRYLLHWHRETSPNNVWESHIDGVAKGYYNTA